MEGSGSVQIIKRIRIQETEKYRLRIWNIASKQYTYEPRVYGAALFFFYEAILSLYSQGG
jgi:hypothetical protein